MDQNELRRIFGQALADRRLSRSERRALQALLGDASTALEDRLAYVGRAFDATRELLRHPHDRELLEALEDLVKTLYPDDIPMVAEAHFAPREECAETLQRLLDDARHSVDICVFTITDNSVVRRVLAAHRRGVKLRIVSDNEKSLDRGSDIDRLRQEGVPVRLDRSENHMHHKFALFDRRLLVTGSYNWTRSADERNRENIAVTDDRRLVEQFLEEFELLWKEFEHNNEPYY